MKDIKSVALVETLHPTIVRAAYIKSVNDVEAVLGPYIAVRTVQATRTFPYQDHLYALGRTIVNPDGYDKLKKPMGNVVTNAKAGQGYHCYALAGDFAILYDQDRNGTFEKISWDMIKDGNFDHIADWTQIKDAFIANGFEWGGNFRSFPDNPHVQMTFGHDWRDLLARYNKHDFIPGTHYLQL